MKKWITFLLCIALMLGLFCPVLAAQETVATAPVAQETAPEAQVASAEDELLPAVEEVYQPEEENPEGQRLKKRSVEIYRKALAASGKESLGGFCGLMTGLQIWKMGLTLGAETYDGNDFFDAYAKQTETSAGYVVRTIGADAMDLEEALNHITACGTRNVYNLIACFQWTNTEAGGVCGHAVAVQGVVDGNVYFVEGFYTSLAGPEGTPIVCSIAEFANYFSDWTIYEGLIWLGEKEYTDYCEEYPTDLLVTANGGMILDMPGQDALVVRPVQDGELLRAQGIYKNPDGQFYYRVGEGYIESRRCAVQQVNQTGVRTEVSLPEITPDKPFSLGCKLYSAGGNISAVKINILDDGGNLIQSASFASSGRMCAVSRMDVAALKEGNYTAQVMAMVESNLLAEDGQLQVEKKLVPVHQAHFTVGEVTEVFAAAPLQTDGWSVVGEKRYYYKDGKPHVGWLCDNGNDYFFAPDGSVTTGWVKINGQWRCFTDTGVMRIGWVDAPWGRCYLLSNGVPVTGDWEVEGMDFSFDENGAMILK